MTLFFAVLLFHYGFYSLFFWMVFLALVFQLSSLHCYNCFLIYKLHHVFLLIQHSQGSVKVHTKFQYTYTHSFCSLRLCHVFIIFLIFFSIIPNDCVQRSVQSKPSFSPPRVNCPTSRKSWASSGTGSQRLRMLLKR